MTPTLTAYRWVPDFARGHVRDHRCRWACEEVGLAYQTRLIDNAEAKSEAHLAIQPFGQIPTYRDDDGTIFESGAIVLSIAEQAPGLLPDDPAGRTRAIQWLIAALNSVDPFVMQLAVVDIFEADQPWSAMRRPAVIEALSGRLAGLSRALGDKSWLDGESFTVGDLMMVCVLRGVDRAVLAEFPNLAAYVARGESRPAFERSMADHLADFTDQPVAA
ncbi:glutathione S-transferase family protein [Sphingomonas koreensis]|nr:glutathione S-transferase family protein [Sphingomonas koreensis]TPG39827.1 glutathione S-transferase family protein [Sphingomonas koreensis]